MEFISEISPNLRQSAVQKEEYTHTKKRRAGNYVAYHKFNIHL